VFRRFSSDDALHLELLLGDATAMRYVGDGTPADAAAVNRWLEAATRWADEPGGGLWALHHRSTGRFVGYCGVARGEDTGKPELMYALLPAWWGQGLGTEAAASVVELADRDLPELLATADPANVASLRILARLGFTVIHTAPDVHGLTTVFLRRIRQDADCSVETT
jgi:ribosomal-protein-alanine N-acetyltransferase